MQYSSLGNGAARISRLGLGGNIFGYACDAAESAHLIHAASALGVNVIDTADTYSEGASESYIGVALRHRRGDWFLATKAGVRSGEEPHGFAAGTNLRRKLEGSLRRLGTDCVDLYQLHHFDPATPLDETLSALGDFRRDGMIRHFGVSNYSAAALGACTAACDAAPMPRPLSAQCAYNLFVRNAESELFGRCTRDGVGILAYGVLARGLLGGRYRRLEEIPADSRAARSTNIRGDIDEEMLARLRAIAELVGEYSMEISQAALLWTLRAPVVKAAVVGVRTQSQLSALCAAFDLAPKADLFDRLTSLAAGAGADGALKFGAQRHFG